MGTYRIILSSKESWKTLSNPQVIGRDIFNAKDDLNARIRAVQELEKELGENDYCVTKSIRLD